MALISFYKAGSIEWNILSWPTVTVDDNDADDDDDDCSVEDNSCVTKYLHQYTENASRTERLKFWVGWEAPTTTVTLEVIDCHLPKSSMCIETLGLPAHFQPTKDFSTFKEELQAYINTADTGFGLVCLSG
ncbi:hypothetical protein P4O66_009471 [Electrophorus voltai]|uniref:Uncharacterized protein n=1 Tax=Electrophorus voltai TaxID=2609070 RepID=A0AAD8ZBS7_9TELE|nr:hypothetical protein P4O66_009471 [Electrophorus voltai]